MPRRVFSGRLSAAIAGAAALAALAATSSPAATTAATPRCASSGLVIWLETQGNGALGSIYYNLDFTNLSGHACTLVGYPGVSAVNLGRGCEPNFCDHSNPRRNLQQAREDHDFSCTRRSRFFSADLAPSPASPTQSGENYSDNT